MKLFEYEAKNILAKYGIPTPQGALATGEAQVKEVTAKIKPPFVVKAQVLVAGRGKAGGILFADSVEEAEKAAGKILKMRIKGMPVKSVWIDCRPKTLSSKSSVSSIFVLSRHSTTY